MDELIDKLGEVCEHKDENEYHSWDKRDFYLEGGVLRVKKYRGCSMNFHNSICESCKKCIQEFPVQDVQESGLKFGIGTKYSQKEAPKKVKNLQRKLKELEIELEWMEVDISTKYSRKEATDKMKDLPHKLKELKTELEWMEMYLASRKF